MQVGVDTALFLSGDNEVGPVSITGAAATGFEATVGVESAGGTPAELNASDAEPITVSDADLIAVGALGPLKLSAAQLASGTSAPPARTTTVPSLSLDSASTATFNIVSNGSTARG